MAGDPSLAVTESIVLELEKAGANLIELGVPFSDPIADGPVIQKAAERGLTIRHFPPVYFSVSENPSCQNPNSADPDDLLQHHNGYGRGGVLLPSCPCWS